MSEVNLNELNTYEKFALVTTICGDFIVKSTSFVDSKVKIDQKSVEEALIYMQKRHPLLRSTLNQTKEKNCRYEIDEKLIGKYDFTWVDLNSKDEIIKELERFNSKLFNYDDGKSLLWRFMTICYQEKNSTKYCFNLAVSLPCTDGINISSLMVEFVNILNGVLTQAQTEEMISKYDLLPSLHSNADKYGLFTEAQREAVDRLNKAKKVQFLLPDKFKSESENGLKISLIKFDKQLTNRIVETSKREKTRATGFLTTAALYALKQLYDEAEVEFPAQCNAEIPANLRIRTTPNLSFSNMRLQVSIGLFETDSAQFGEFKEFWRDTRYIQTLVNQCTDTETATFFASSHGFDLLESLNKLAFDNSPSKSEICTAIHPFNSSDLLVSNVGPHVFNQMKLVSGPVSIREIYFGDSLGSQPRILPALMFHVLFWDGEMFIELSSNLSAIAAKYVDRYVALFKRVVETNV